MVWLAVPDGQPSPADLQDPYETQLGGSLKVPAWAEFDRRQACCGVCGHPLYLLLQAFCPHEDLERVFLVFACNTAACQAQPEKSWQAWRFQRRAPDAAETRDGSKGEGEAPAHAASASDSDGERDDADPATALVGLPPTVPYTLPCFAVDMFEEPEKEEREVDLAEEIRRMEEINCKTDQRITTEDLDEVHESLQPTPVDMTFLSFQKRLERCPRQAVRWGIAHRPLWISSVNLPTSVPPCVVCGGPRVTELQLLPTLVFFLKPYDHCHVAGDEGLDFGTATLYSCASMCTNAVVSPEYVHVQPAPTE